MNKNILFSGTAFALLAQAGQVSAHSHFMKQTFVPKEHSYIFMEIEPFKGVPMYNLFYLSKALAEGNNSQEVIGSINSLFSNSKHDVSDKAFIMSFLNQSAIESKWRKALEAYLVQNISLDNSDDKARKELINNIKTTLSIEESIINKNFDSLEKSHSAVYQLRQIPILDSLNSIVEKYNINLLSDSIKTSVEKPLEKITSLKDSANIVQLNTPSFKSKTDLYDTLKSRINDFNYSVNKIIEVDSTLKILNYNGAINLIPYFKSYTAIYDSLRSSRDKAIDDLVDFLVNKELSSTTSKQITSGVKEESFSAPTQVLNAQAAIQQEQSYVSGFKLPSESDVIKALAQFMANRAKQEALIWFLKQLQKDMQSPLLWDMFPETKRLVDAYDGISIPDFDDTWRMALSADLVHMPNNMVHGLWLDYKVEDRNKLNQLKAVVTLSNYFYKLVREKSNYRTVIQNLYLATNEIHEFKEASHIKEAINLLYVVSNELYSVNEGSISYLTLDQINGIDLKQWNIFLHLVKVKYGGSAFKVFKTLFNNGKIDVSSLSARERDFYDAEQNANEIYLSLNKDKLNTVVQNFSQLQTLSKSSSGNEQAVSFLLVWDKMIELLKFADPEFDVVRGKFNAKKFTDIAQLEALHKIYGNLSRKEFKPAVDNTIDLVKPLLGFDKFTISKNDNSFSIISGKDKILLDLKLKNKDGIYKLINDLKFSEVNLKGNELNFHLRASDTKSVNFLDLVDEFKRIRYSYKDTNHKDTLIKNFNNNFPVINKVFCHFYNDSEITEEKIKFINLIADLYDNPKHLLTKPIYSSFDLKQKIQGNLLKNEGFDKLLGLTSMFSNIINSKDQSGIYKAIQELAAPPESYMIKRNAVRTWTVNGYVGGFAGYQDVLTVPSDYTKSFIYGITAPIGITYNYKRFGVFFQGLELGNVVNHYLWNTRDDVHRQKLTIKEMFSPGISFLHNIPNGPFVAFISAKAVQIEKRFDNEIVYNKRNLDLLQFTAGIKIDIPFFTLSKSGI